MKKLLIIFLIVVTNFTFSQTIEEVDSVSYIMCNFLENVDISNDTLKINSLYEEQMTPFLSTVEEENKSKVSTQLWYRLQKNCVEFRNLLDRLDPPKGDHTRSAKQPKSKISKKDLQNFKDLNEFYYFEASGEKTKVIAVDGIWLDLFSDSTYSKLTYNWISKTEFELVFIESDNESRSNFSIKGDMYLYKVLSKENQYYLISISFPEQNVFETLKLYYD